MKDSFFGSDITFFGATPSKSVLEQIIRVAVEHVKDSASKP